MYVRYHNSLLKQTNSSPDCTAGSARIVYPELTMHKRKHILVISFPALGHYLPLLELAKRLVAHHEITVTYSQANLSNLERRHILPPAPIKLLPLADQLTTDFEEGVNDVKQIVKTMDSTELFYPDFCRNLPQSCNQPIDAVIIDSVFYATFSPLQEVKVKVYSFNAFPISMTLKRLMITDSTPTVADNEYFTKGWAGVPQSLKVLAMKVNKSMDHMETMIFSSFEDLEPGAVETLKKFKPNLDVKFVGPLLHFNEHVPDNKVTDFLDRKLARSVVYVSFGTVAIMSAEQIAQVAEALLSLKRPFIWSLRPAQLELLPSKITHATDDHLILPWVPQKHILSHKATAVFVSHCGWNSTLEALSYGIPIVAWPSFGDQLVNAALVEKLETGLMIKSRNTVSSDEIVGTIEKVAGWNGSADRYAQNAEELKVKAMMAVAPDGKSTQDLLQIVKDV
ncbi:uncharacterized protein LOC129602041 [Paramacrobiotus metropolitanus]|uniref:uncharacterized protein LOC129602041 n=1 Tax=Paramacrobiotus metropolitanus TaxID=2943436 RepID=UPI002445FFC7|nr:uncharacterized protein LOC129602041 [Paramacrobiotus metropolitanus]